MGAQALAPSMLMTARLRLRPARVSDAEAIFAAYAQDPDVTRYLIWRPHGHLLELCQPGVWR